jgi:DNA-binding CsgD family transcriptional regulator
MAAQPTLPMPRLSHSELRAFSKTLLDLYSPGPLADLPARVFAAGARHISCEHSAYHEFFDQNPARIVHDPEIRAETSVFNHYADQHPALARIIKDQIQCAVKISDFNTQAQWHGTDLYNHFFRLEGLNYQLGYLALNKGRRFGLAFNRMKRDFGEQERFLLNLLTPHLLHAFQSSQLFSLLSEQVEASGKAWLVVDEAGHILFHTGKAIDWLREYFGNSGSLPAEIRDWLKRRASALADKALTTKLQDFSIGRGAKRLTVRSLSSVQAAEHRLVLAETSEELDANLLQTLGLTKREAEVLFWVSQGKRNCEIAEILGARSRTIGKHVERILGKLCVETRTAAANIAAEVLHLR